MKFVFGLMGALLASLLLVASLGSSPIQAANSAAEALDDDGSRPLAGSTRYATALKIAQRFIDESADVNGTVVTDAILVSGTGFADALSAAALAGHFQAPILLTHPTVLTGAVRSFITRNNIDDVFIVGGPAAVSTSVATALGALPGVDVERLSGANRYATALAVAREVAGSSGGNLSTYCSTNDRAVLLANGDGFADALASGGLAYNGPTPLLLTPKAGLPADVLTFLTETRTERVVILGGTAVVPAAIQSQLTAMQIAVTRLAGANRFATATAIATALTTGPGTCSWEPDNFGLANGRTPYDALAGSPLLGLRRDPLLLVEPTSVHAATSAYLSATPNRRNNTATLLTFSVLGGTSTVPRSVVASAIETATTSNPITATVVARPGESSFVINFSEEVDPDSAERHSSYLFENDLLINDDTIIYYSPDTTADNPNAHVEIELDRVRLAADNTITIKPNAIKALQFDQDDNRTVGGTTFRVPTDSLRPRVTIYAVPDATTIWVRLSETPHDRDGTTLSSFNINLDRATGTDLNNLAVSASDSPDSLLWATTFTGDPLSPGDRVSIASRQLHDIARNANSSTQVTVSQASRPTLTALSVTRLQHPSQATTGFLSGLSGLSVAARSTGDYAGATGNSWYLEVVDSDRTNLQVVERRLRVVISLRDISGGASDDSAVTVRELLRAADASADFTRNFQFVGRSDLTTAELNQSITAARLSYTMSGGETHAVVSTRWSQPLTTLTESDIDVCPARCDIDNDPIPTSWTPTDRSAHNGTSEFLEWEIIDSDEDVTVPTTAWSLKFTAGAVGGEGGAENLAIARRLRLR